jgi:LmbE family N-acetylglucosaminyl deacetylase
MQHATTQTPPLTLFILAHNDDEFFVLPRIKAAHALGQRVALVFTTDGAAYGESPQRRLAESISALAFLPNLSSTIISLGMELGVRDGTSHHSIQALWDTLAPLPEVSNLTSIYAPAWEGGHVDHDVAHLLAVALARKTGAQLYEFSLYHGCAAPPPLFRCMQLLPSAAATLQIDNLSWREAFSWLLSCRHYRSQARSFIGLIGFCIPEILGRRRLVTRRVHGYRYDQRPHRGALLYESRFKVPYETFYACTSEFVRAHVGESLQQSNTGHQRGNGW